MIEFLAASVAVAIAFWFGFYVVNHAEITAKFREEVLPRFHPLITAMLGCPLCLAFWALLGWCAYQPTALILTVPPLALFIDRIYQRLS